MAVKSLTESTDCTTIKIVHSFVQCMSGLLCQYECLRLACQCMLPANGPNIIFWSVHVSDDKACGNCASKTSFQVVLSVSIFTRHFCLNGDDVFRSSTELTFKNVTAIIHSISFSNILTSEEF